MLFAKNGPEWSMAYFGILKAGATAVPLGHESTVAEIVNVARASGAAGILIGDDLLDKRAGLTRALREAGLATKVWPFPQGLRAARPGGRARARRLAGQQAQPRHAGVADLHLGDDRQAQGGHADPPQLHLHGGRAVEDLRVRRQRRHAVGAAAAPHLRVLDGPAGAAGARRADHLPARADRRRHRQRAEEGARHRHRRRAGAVGSDAAARDAAVLREVAAAGDLHEGAHGGELRAALAHQARSRHAVLPADSRRVRRAHPLPDQRRLGAAGRGAEDLPRHGLQLLRGLRPDRDGAGADGDVAQGEAHRRLGGQAAARASRSRSTSPTPRRAWAR